MPQKFPRKPSFLVFCLSSFFLIHTIRDLALHYFPAIPISRKSENSAKGEMLKVSTQRIFRLQFL